MSLRLFLPTSADTDELGGRLAETMPDAAVLWLRGDLGAGKSSLARSLLRALGVLGAIKSPTYTLIERYPLPDGEAVHLDLYRIADAAELDFLGLEDLHGQARLWLVEWPERGAGSLPPPDLEVSMEVTGDGRQAELRASTENGRAWLTALSNLAGPGVSS